MGLQTGIKNDMLEELRTQTVKGWLYDTEPTNPTSSIETITFAAASGGSMDLSANVVFDVAATKTVSNIAIADTNSGLLALVDITNETFTNAGTYTLTQLLVSLS